MNNEIERIIELIAKTWQLTVNNLKAQECLLVEIHKSLQKINGLVIPASLLKELAELENETRFGVNEMVCQAIRRYIDSEKSDGEHIWFNGVKYPLPEKHRMP